MKRQIGSCRAENGKLLLQVTLKKGMKIYEKVLD